jgi:aminopeptidase YwaD
MHAFKKTLALSLGLGLAACSAGSGEPDHEGLINDPAAFAPGEQHSNGSDPMTHISYLASDLMKGRNSPSADLNTAGAYVRTFLERHGLTGPNPSDANGPYAQTFSIGTFNAAGADAHSDANAPHEFGVTLFQEAFYLDQNMSRTAQDTLSLRYEEAMAARGLSVGPHQLRPVAELQASATVAGTAQNVLGKLNGTGPKSNEVVVIMAHLDHIGTTTGGVVFNGADDNASGSATILSIIPALVAAQQAGQLNRSLLFLWTAAEEKGLVGAQFFVDHPIAGIGLSNISGVINMDMVARWDDQRLSVIDTTTSGSANFFRALLDSANTSMPDPFDKLNRDIATYIDRQDGWAFMNAGEDVLFLFEGLSNPAGGGSLNPDYHATGDDIEKIIADNGGNKARRVRDLLVDVVKRTSNR